MHTSVVSAKALQTFRSLGTIPAVSKFYLAGGTALAFFFGHRRSVDFDFFSKTGFSPIRLETRLQKSVQFRTSSIAEGTLNGVANGTKVSFFSYPYRLLFPVVRWEGVQLADPRDIACMKLIAISSRGSKKDFVDFYFLLQHYALESILHWCERKYRRPSFQSAHLLKSLGYFEDAEAQPMPAMLQPVQWRAVKVTISAAIQKHFLS